MTQCIGDLNRPDKGFC